MSFKVFKTNYIKCPNYIFLWKDNEEKCIKSYNWFQKICTTKTCFLLFTCSSGELNEKPNHMKISKSLKLRKKIARERIFV
jgi:hypothetical protein